MTFHRKKQVLVVRVRAWNKEVILPQRLDFVMSLLKKNVNIKFFDIQPERKLGYYVGYFFSFLAAYPRLLFTPCDSVILENPYLVIFAPIFKLRRKKILAEYVDYYPANLHRLQNERFFRYQVAKIVCRVFHHFVDRITIESETGERTLQHWGVSKKKISILPVGIDTQKMLYSAPAKEQLRKQLGMPESSIVVGYLGKMVKFYHLESILQAVSQFKGSKTELKLVFVGDGPYKSELEELSKNLGLGVLFTGNVPHDQVYAYYSLMDFFIFPLNSLAIKIGEILSVKGPILIVTKGMPEDWIKDNVNGIVATSSSPSAIKNALSRSLQLSDPEKESIVTQQRKFAVEHLDKKIVARNYLKLI